MTGSFEVRRRIVCLGDEELRRHPVVQRLKDVADLNELLLDRTEKGESGLNLVLGIGRLDGGRDHGDEPAFGCHLVRVAYHGDVNIRVSPDLLLRDDDLGREGVLGVGHGVVKQANASDNLTNFADFVRSIGRVAVYLK